ncbi:hypothetical protein [Flavobacterium orientale]|uniref:Chain length determinant protein n=1 Tax=Flavobacterium orientale TaxID=1756020 RepID=A0A916XZ04_9FLAO|nr:hypothetical protein [Flavobacterium orientale]GGD22588.1 hypothetical protein GCM10011343_10990 [Flavobacterium orientale]
MSSTPQQNDDNQEIDLSEISKKISNAFEGFLMFFFNWILFLKRNLIWVVSLFVIGVGLGFYLDKTTNIYDNQVIVMPNFGSNDYLYSKVEQLNAKIKEDDTIFLKKIGIKNVSKLKKIEIEPINDVYRFISNKTENFDLIKLMSEDGNIQKILEDKVTSKNYPYHRIKFVTSERTTDEKTKQPILSFLNDSDYFKIIQNQIINNTNLNIKLNEQMLEQIDGILAEFSSSLDASALKSDRLVYYNNENSQLNDVLKTKENLIKEQSDLKVHRLNIDKIIKELSSTLNNKNTKSVNGKLKYILPILFVFGFIIISLLSHFYKRQQQKLANAEK